MVNGLRNLYSVKAFFLKIVAGIRSIASILSAFAILVKIMTRKYNGDDN